MDEDEGTWIALSAATRNLVVLVHLKEQLPATTEGLTVAGALVAEGEDGAASGDELLKRA